MGLLDDAIREHLDLKRRRGADPAEVERAEQEALGPVRRNREPAGDSEVDPEPADGGLAYDQADDDGWTYAADGEELPPLDLANDEPEPAFGGSEAAFDEPEPAFGGSEPAFDEPAAGAVEPDSVSERPVTNEPVPPVPPPRFAHLGEPQTAEYDVEAEHAHGEESDGDDMLDQTPEFLQDTPDHDQLWFEQRPPKDFDFDD